MRLGQSALSSETDSIWADNHEVLGFLRTGFLFCFPEKMLCSYLS